MKCLVANNSWKNVASLILSVLSISIFSPTGTVTAFDYSLDFEAEEPPALSLTDVVTGIPDIKTLFIGEPTLVTVKDLSWMFNDGNASGVDLLLWTTSVDGVVVASGNYSLLEFGRQLPTSVEAGTFTVSSSGMHEVVVTLSVDGSSGDVTGDYAAYKSGVSLIPMILVLVMAMTTQMVHATKR
jgi:hypothetical protein